MSQLVSDLLAAAHVPIGMYIVYRCIVALRVTHDGQSRFAIECVLGIAAAVIALRLTDYTIPLEGEARYVTWRALVSLAMLSFLPLINALARSDRRQDD
ncbi:hypothetical protein TW86_14215 [Halomonas sp. S2151]|uniref:hypothetical protein n=1 Tax=Halomonas TaxID=2745 RepID=UPI0005FA5F20|nr:MULTISPECIES: hypothetical protein [Halomonas]MBR9770029.1 hypothetical protein [Gammaproteobacteria bacterium]KJZ10445.1 hypothetical protein TW86_14215 [Halomonas sp. S2151]MBY6109089.1 hypothetical protein [Halomonas sp. DP1Y21-3]MBY6208751.1 hypothetical protein [Halomonas sp. DP3Y7-2]MBY6227221.1 hypothetical protein [Halomonas sp. DP3Y7-1]